MLRQSHRSFQMLLQHVHELITHYVGIHSVPARWALLNAQLVNEHPLIER
jgi:hypothetical protein